MVNDKLIELDSGSLLNIKKESKNAIVKQSLKNLKDYALKYVLRKVEILSNLNMFKKYKKIQILLCDTDRFLLTSIGN